MLLASSGMLPDAPCAYSKSYELCTRDHELCSRLAGKMPARASRMLALPDRLDLLTWPGNGNYKFAVLFSDEVFRAAAGTAAGVFFLDLNDQLFGRFECQANFAASR